MKITMYLLTALITMMTGLTQGFVCTDNYCQSVNCPKDLTKESCQGHFIPNSSRCACCPTCVTYLKPFSYCNEPSEESSEPENFMKHKCPQGYVCALHRCSPLI